MYPYSNLLLNSEQVERLEFQPHDDYWSDIDGNMYIYELIDGSGYQQFVYDANCQEKLSFGISLKTVDDLMKRYKSITGLDARYYPGKLPITGQ